MKKIYILLSLTAMLSADVNWTNYKEAYNKRDNGKPMLIIVGATTCGFCKKEKDNINQNEELVSLINSSLNPVYINQDKDFTPVDLISSATPAIFFAKPDGTVLTKPMLGVVNNEELFQYAKIIIKRNK